MTLNSLKHSIYSPTVLDIQDDGSSVVCQKMLSQIVETLVSTNLFDIHVEYASNQGLIKARNESYDRLINNGCKYIAVIHNDMMFAKGMFEQLMFIMDNNPDIGILAAETIKLKNQNTQEDLDARQAVANASTTSFFRGNNHPAIMRVSALLKILENGKVYDESFGRHDGEDIDLLGRLEYAGYKTLVTTKAWGYHQGEASRSSYPDVQKWKDYSRAMYERKWIKKGLQPWDSPNNPNK